MSQSDKASSRRGRRWLWLAPLLVLAVPLWLAALTGLFLETDLGKRTAARLLETVLSQPGQQVEIGRLEGSFFGELRIESLRVSDDAGAWLELDGALLQWDPAALFRGRLSVERLSADRLALARLPPPGPATPDSDGPLLPDLPVEIEAKAVAVERIELGEAVLGEAATLSLDGDLLLARERADVDLAVTRRDAAGGFIAANLAWEPATDVLRLSLQAQEPAGGVVARLAELPGLPALDVALDGAGTLAAWKGKLRLALGGQDALSADIALSGDETQSLDLKGRVTREGALLVEKLGGIDGLAAWAPDGIDLDVAATRRQGQDGSEQITVGGLSLASSVFTLEGSGSLDGDAVRGQAKAALADGRPLAGLVPDLALASGDFELTLGGTLQQPSATLAFDARDLAYDVAAFERARGTLAAKTLDGGAFDLALTLHAVRPQMDDPVPEWIWGDADLTAEGTLAADGAFDLRQLDLQASKLKLAWQGQLGIDAEGAVALPEAVPQALSVDGRLPAELIAMVEKLSGVDGLAAWAPDGLDLVADARRQGGRIDVRRLSLASGVFRLEGSGALEGEAVRGKATLNLADGRPLAFLVPELTLAGGDFDVTVDGTLSQPRATLDFDTARIAYDLATFDRSRGRLTATGLGDDAYDLTLELHAANPQLEAPAPAWIWGDGELAAAGRIDAEGAFELKTLTLDARDMKLSWNGSLDTDSLAADGHLLVDGRLPELAQLPGAILDVDLDATLKSDDLTRAGAATLAGHLQGSGTLPPEAADLLRAGIDFAGGVELAEDGTLRLSAASMQGRGLSVDIDGSMKDRDVDFSFRLAADDLSAIASALGTEAAGGLTLDGTLSGDEKAGYSATVALDGRALVVAGESIGALSGTLDLNGFPKEPHGQLALSAPATAYGPMKVSASVTPQATGGFLLDPLSIELGSTLQLAGKLESAAGGLPLAGTLSGSVQGSPLLAELAGLDLSGRGQLQLKLTAPNGRQDAEIVLNLEPGTLFGTAHRGLRLAGTAQDLLGTPRLDMQANGSGVALGGTVIESLRATARGALNALDVTAVASGTSDGEAISVDLAAQIDAMAASPPIRLQRLQGKAMAQDFRLLQPTTLRLGDTLQLDSTKLQVGETTVVVELSDRPGERQLKATFDPIKAELLAAFLPDYEPSGSLSATLVLTDRGSGATGTIEVNGRELLLRQRGLSVAPAIDVAGTAKLGGGSLATSLQLSGSFGKDLLIEATFPFRFSLYSFDVTMPSDGKLAGRASWNGDVAQLVDFLPFDNQVLRGELALDLTLAGTVSAPQVQGELTLQKGHYENLVYGTVLKSLTLQLTGEGSRLVVREASASDGHGGTMTIGGSIELSPLAMDLTMTLRKFAIMQRDDLFAAVDGDLTVGPKGGREQVLAGTVTSEEVRLDVAARLPNQVTTLDVVMLKDGQAIGPARENAGAGSGGDWREDKASLPFVLGLDIKVDLPNKIYVHGSGLESEWGGHLKITGTTDQPIIRGQLTPKRGQFDALGKAFVLQDSAITFDGGPTVDPILAIKATADSGDITAIVEVTGRASQPEIRFTSNPVLPEDEVLSRVLFGRGTGKLSALEAVQLAEALAIFSGASKHQVGLVDRMRAALGLDVLRFEAGETDDDIGVITAGEYIRKDVFVGVSQGTTAGSTSAKVEYQATDDIVIEGEVGQASSIGVRWQWDY